MTPASSETLGTAEMLLIVEGPSSGADAPVRSAPGPSDAPLLSQAAPSRSGGVHA
jgi:hypothetical protein